MIKLINVCKSFKTQKILKSINLEIKEGETLAIIGSSGSGKSTLLRLMIGLIKPTSGEIWIKDTEISQLEEEALDKVRLGMGMVFQYSALFDSMKVGENVAFGLREHTDFSEEKIQNIIKEKLKMVDLEGYENVMPNELSGGMKKRVSLARAIAFNPEIVFYDEPSSGLDPIMTAKIDELIVSTQKALHVTSVVVTHDMASAYHIADRIAMIYEGEIIALATVKEIKKSKDPRVTAFLHGIYMEKEEDEE
jgi:phospholipid/cholesterol/gamma-HCH transport system ATP-binding protein